MSQYSHNIVDVNNPNTTWTKLYNFIDKKSNVLDVGCSSGYFAAVLIKNKGCIVDGIELDSVDAKKAAKICRKVLVGSIENEDLLKKINNKYDFIIFADVLEHLINPSKVLKNASRLLKNDGKILFSVPNMAHISVVLELLNGSFMYEDTGLLDRTHLHFYTKGTVLEVINQSGMTLEKLDFTSYDLPKHIIDKGLKRAGLLANPKFYKNSDELSIFQYIAVLSTKLSPNKNIKKEYPFKAIKENDMDRKKMMDHIIDLEKTNKNLRTALDEKIVETQVLNTKLGKVIKKIYRKE